MSGWETFPSFEPAFQKSEEARVPFYLMLLGPSDDAEFAIKKIRACIRRSGANLAQELKGLLAHTNWRMHLVAAVAMLVSDEHDDQLSILWNAIHRPSWVSPQLAATAWRLDPDFTRRAQILIERRCVLDLDDGSKLGWVERHSALGPGSFEAHSAKLMAALVELCSSSNASWLETLREELDIREMIASDVDRGGQIATHWINRIERWLTV